ncbi:helix-turn-helix transcriptional regulator [Zymobacter palmae]|uniref:DNA-binding HTH domain-containing proteins n=1 Tax=Zymobacter palmae TaxID=33074 RepID=A0A348HDA9_9GAMM|nr:autoinducer binding domain-containing protein [Zymobacter palmae]BBG29611.1 DNA-binding HTH domain-containing proteins [Zymobacter palmae]
MNANNWKIDLFSSLDAAQSLQGVMDASVAAVRPFGFDFCVWRLASSDTQGGQHLSITSSNDMAHQQESARRYDDSPSSRHCLQSSLPFSWLGTTQDKAFHLAPELFEEYYGLGHHAGWSKSIDTDEQHYNMFYVESTQPFSAADMHSADQHLQWVCAAAYVRLNELPTTVDIALTAEQRQILRLYAQGCPHVEEIADVLHKPLRWINAVLENACKLLGCTDINMAVARAIFLRLLY